MTVAVCIIAGLLLLVAAEGVYFLSDKLPKRKGKK
jgi:hypothetical protein